MNLNKLGILSIHRTEFHYYVLLFAYKKWKYFYHIS